MFILTSNPKKSKIDPKNFKVTPSKLHDHDGFEDDVSFLPRMYSQVPAVNFPFFFSQKDSNPRLPWPRRSFQGMWKSSAKSKMAPAEPLLDPVTLGWFVSLGANGESQCFCLGFFLRGNVERSI